MTPFTRFFLILSCVFIVACDEHHHHEGDVLFSVSKIPFSCESISSVRFVTMEGEDASEISQKFGADRGSVEFLGTLCNALVERTFSVACERLEQYGLLNPRVTLELVLLPEKERLELFFGRKTPDGFGQYIFLNHMKTQGILNSKLRSNGNPCEENTIDGEISVLVIPAYHLEQLTPSDAKNIGL